MRLENHYDPRLRKLLRATSKDEVVLNKEFFEFIDDLKIQLRIRDPEELIRMNRQKQGKRILGASILKENEYKIDEYEIGNLKTLKQRCEEHAKTFEAQKNKEQKRRKSLETTNVIVLVHPLYLALTDMEFLDAKERPESVEQAKTYLNNLFKLLRGNLDKKKVEIALVETPTHYAAASSLLVEEGLIDKVIFTRYDQGIPLNPDDKKLLDQKNAFYGGGYVGYIEKNGKLEQRCFSQFVTRTWNLTANNTAIQDLIIQSPQSKDTSIMDETAYGLFQGNTFKERFGRNHIRVDELVKRFSISPEEQRMRELTRQLEKAKQYNVPIIG